MNRETPSRDLTLIVGATGKTGRRVVERLKSRGVPTRAVSRSSEVRFDWGDRSTWIAALEGVSTAYITYAPDLAIPGAVESVEAFVDLAVESGIRRLVLLSGRGEEEAQRCEKVIQRPEVEWTVVRASWFAQNFSEGPFIEMVISGEITLPAGDVGEPFIDVDDIADVVTAALTEEGHSGLTYEVTGPRLLTFADAAQEMAEATGRPIRYRQVPADAFATGMAEAGLPAEIVWLMDYLFTRVLDGRNAYVSDGVQRALGRDPKDFSDYARQVVGDGVWEKAS